MVINTYKGYRWNLGNIQEKKEDKGKLMAKKKWYFIVITLFLFLSGFLLPSIASASEPNNTPETATEIVLGQQMSDSITYSGENNWFRITVDHTCSIVSDITSVNAFIRYTLYDSTLNQLSLKQPVSSGKFGYKVDPGTYYIKLNEHSNINYATNSITLTVNLREQDAYENNDNSASAVEITPGQTLSNIGIEATNDADWFKINIDHTCSIVSHLTQSNGTAG
jgi:hypothetical protein